MSRGIVGEAKNRLGAGSKSGRPRVAQQAQEEAEDCAAGLGSLDFLVADSLMSIRLGLGCACAVSIPGRAVASFRNKALMLNPALALDSMNMMPSLLALSSPSSTETCRFSDKSVLFPTSIMITSFPRSFRTSSIHFVVFRNDARSGIGREREHNRNTISTKFGKKALREKGRPGSFIGGKEELPIHLAPRCRKASPNPTWVLVLADNYWQGGRAMQGGRLLVISKTTTATDESLMYDGISERNLS